MSASINELIEMAIITDDDFFLLLAAEEQEQNKIDIKPKFNFEKYEAPRCKVDFRFEKNDILRLVQALEVPAELKTIDGRKFTGIEGMCILLRRLAYPQRLSDLQHIFGRSIQALSAIFSTMINFMYKKHRRLVSSLDHWWMQKPSLLTYSRVIAEKGCPLPRCIGFIDGTLNPIARPKYHQRECYSGHRRRHGLKYQSIVLPNGLIASLLGGIPGRRHDSYMLQATGLLPELQDVLGAEEIYLYADAGYPLNRFIIKPFLGNTLSQQEATFNKTMSGLRVVVEWEFGDLFNNFAFLDYHKNMKLWLQPVAKYMVVGTVLKNCKTCLYQSETSKYFNILAPNLENYVRNEEP